MSARTLWCVLFILKVKSNISGQNSHALNMDDSDKIDYLQLPNLHGSDYSRFISI